jgi:hypothetical protein
MRLRIHKPGRPDALTTLAELCNVVDRCIPAARTAFLVAGVAAAALDTDVIADFLFATGLAFHFAICFENWWLSAQAR